MTEFAPAPGEIAPSRDERRRLAGGSATAARDVSRVDAAVSLPVRRRWRGWGGFVAVVLLVGAGVGSGVGLWRTSGALRALGAESERWEQGWDAPSERLHEAIVRMDAYAARVLLGEDGAARAAFDREAHGVTAKLVRAAERGVGAPDSQALERVRQAWIGYLAELAPMLEKPVRALRRDTASTVYGQIDAASDPLREACRAWGRVRGEAGLEFPERVRRMVMDAGRDARLAWGLGVGMVGLGLGLGWGLHARGMRRAQEELAARVERREELASLGTFMAGVAHEIRHPLAAIKVRLFELRRQQTDGAALGTVEVMEGEVRRLERMLDEVLAYARPAELRCARVEVGELIAGVAELVRGAYERRGIGVGVERGESLTVEVDAEQIRQVLLNLVRNAAESLGEGARGSVRLRAAAGVEGRGRGRVQPVVLVEVTDTGPGIPESVQPRLFEPFFSTKPGGTGLGLAIAQRMVEAHGGVLRYRTQPGTGTTFTLVLPRVMHDEGTIAAG